MKMLLQQMWLDKLSWDDTLPPKISVQWQSIVKDLHLLNNFRIPRIIVYDSYTELELHIFTDASERAYGACVYVRSLNGKDHCMVRLLSAKSRVAPIKPTTIPRLELCGALVGARLYDKVINSLRAKISRVYCWTDSTIVLGWLQMLPCKLQPFVRNRVADILEKTDTCIWRHVPTSMNPADLISRGVNISTLHKLDLWWSGPEFLMEDSSHWPSQVKHSGLLPETRPDVSLGAVVDNGTLRDGLIQFERIKVNSK
ncbi:unnamed protein product [Euphydryas editha]|uniref:Uncharacterized protein n=1 Tax=Euphydryas editha TaxID=104508 RepID=A0AAU9VBU3_EUPED|nr:unnamed protein product [Euphydryas editha]